MMNEVGLRRVLHGQSSGSAHTFGTPRHPSVIDPILSKRVCFYKSGDPQFNGLRMVINNRTFKTFDALLDSLSKKVPLPFGVRNITTPHGVHAICTLDELEDGKSYICSDSRKVKPFNLARARKKLPPWYHARPVSSRRRTVQQARFFPGRSIHKKDSVFLRTPKTLLVFRNGDPTVKHTVLLHKRTTPTFESILEYISELIQFKVMKLLTLDGKRVDGLPGLILCSGTVVAAGREPFRPANYSAYKSPLSSRKSVRRLKVLNRKKRSLPNAPKTRQFSPSSERYIVNQIHNSIVESNSNSLDWESSRILDSVAETEHETCLDDGVEGHGCLLPSDDDIEKSFRVNQDGSMTVEMKVRLTLKEEETIHWTTTLTRSSVANLLSETGLPAPEEEQDITPPNSHELQSPVSSFDTTNKDKNKDNNDEDPPSPCNGAFSESSIEEDNPKARMDIVSPRRAPTPGHKQSWKKQTSMESVKSVTTEGIQEDVVGSYSYREQTEHGAMTEQYCLVKQSTSRPVPKPRRLGSLDTSNLSGRNVSTFKPAEMAEILQVESSREEVTETFLHVYEQQTCQESFLANFCPQGMSASGISFSRPATSETGQFSSKTEREPGIWRPSTASESTSFWRAGSTSLTSDVTLPLLNMKPIQEANLRKKIQKPSKGKVESQQTGVKHNQKVSSKPQNNQKSVSRLKTPKKKQKVSSSEAKEGRNKVKTFSSFGFLRKIYGTKSKSARKMISKKVSKKAKKGQTQNGDGGLTERSKQHDDTLKDLNISSALNEIRMEPNKSMLNVASKESTQPLGTLRRQNSMHQENKNKNEPYDISKSISLPAFNSSSAVTNQYVETWLDNAHLESTSTSKVHTESGKRDTTGLVTVAGEVKCLVETSDTCQSVMTDPLPDNVIQSSVKDRIQSFEIKLSSPMVVRSTKQNNSLTHRDTTLPTTKTSSEIASSEIALQNATPSNSLSSDFPPPPTPPAENTELSNTEYCLMEVSSMASSPLYRLSSVSSQMSDNHPLSCSPTSEKAASPTELTMERAASIRADVPSMQGKPLPRTPSIKRAPLVSNMSLGRTMALRKACMDKYTLCSHASLETSSGPATIVGDNELPNGVSPDTPPEETQLSKSMLDMKDSQLCCTSASPTSLTSEDRVPSASITSGEHPTSHHLQSKETNTPLLSPTETYSPKPLLKKVQIMSSPSPERNSQTKKLSQNSPKLTSLRNHPPEKTVSSNIGIQKQAASNASPSTERKNIVHKPKLQKKLSPYSQSLDLVSPSARRKSNKKPLARNLSSDDASEPTHRTPRKSSSERKRSQSQRSLKSAAECDKKQTCNTITPAEERQSQNYNINRTDEVKEAGQEKPIMKAQTVPQLNIANQPNMQSVLESICCSIKSIRLITQNKRPSRLERSNSLPDFSSHVAATFGSSSKAFLAFLAVMALKEGLTHFNVDEMNAKNVSCTEALKMIDSLKEIASIEDSHALKDSLTNLQQSASKELLDSWRDFKELSDECKSRDSTPNDSEQGLMFHACPERNCDEKVIDEIMNNLDIPEKLKEELASLSQGLKCDNTKMMCTRNIEMEEPSLTKTSHLPSGSANFRDDAQDEKPNVDVSSIIKQFSEIHQPTQSRTGSIRETVKPKQSDQSAEDNNNQSWKNGEDTCPPAESEVRQSHNSGLSETDKGQAMQSCCQQEQGDNEDKSSQEMADMAFIGSRTLDDDEDSRISEVEEHENTSSQLKTDNEQNMSVPRNELTHNDESGSDQEREDVSGADKDLKVSSEGGGSSSEADGSSEEEKEAECEELQESRGNGDFSKVEEDRQVGFNHYEEVQNSKDDLCNSASPSQSEKEEKNTAGSTSVDESICYSDSDEPSSEEEHEIACNGLKVITEEGLSGDKGDELLNDGPDDQENSLKALVEEEEDKASYEDSDRSQNSGGDDDSEIENQVLCKKKDSGSLIMSDSLPKSRLSMEEDSGNDHSSCDEPNEFDQPTVENRQIGSSIEEELSYYGKESSSEEEQANIEIYIEESCRKFQETLALVTQPEDTKCEKAVEKPIRQLEELISQTVAERVTLLEKQVADEQKRRNTIEGSSMRRSSQRNVPLESGRDEQPTSKSAPQSSLSFSYDSSSVITTEPEAGKVRSIREMFLAKSAADTPQERRCIPNPNTSELAELRAQTSTSAGYESQTSSELSSGEDDSAKKSISKGFVRRTIERLYGLRNGNAKEEASERPPSASKEKKNEHSSIFSPFHVVGSKAMQELSYFNSTSALDNLAEARRCIAFNAKVVPGHSIAIDDEHWLISENTQIRKSVSDPVGINKTLTNSPAHKGMCEDTEENTTCSLPGKKSELVDLKERSFSRMCTYFSLPHASDSDACQDDLSIVSKSSEKGDSVIDMTDNSEDIKLCEKNGTLPGVAVTDFKRMDNKVHPLVELPRDGEVVVVVQPGKGQGALNRRLQDPDMLDVLYDFCGQNCPIL